MKKHLPPTEDFRDVGQAPRRMELSPGTITEVHFEGETPIMRMFTKGDLSADRRSLPPSFGPYLAGLRKERGLSLRDAATEVGLSHAYLSQIERGERFPRLSPEVLQRVALAYGRQAEEVSAAAGLSPEPKADRATLIHQAFRALVLHPELCPHGMDAKFWLDSFSVRQKYQWIEFARKLRAWKQPKKLSEEDQALMDVLDLATSTGLGDE